MCVAPGIASAAELTATPASFSSVFSSAQGGDTIRLASGGYGTFRGALKSGMVTITAQAGATPSMAVNFSPASNITLDGLKVTNGYIADSRTKNITIRNSSFDGAQIVLRGGSADLVNANVLLDNNVHSNRNVCSGCYDGRIQIAERTDQPTGVTIQNSRFYGGNMDGILNGGNGTRILNNEFRSIQQDNSDAHTDSIQLYGSKNTLIKGNYFHDVAVGIMCADRCDHETIEDNVFAVNGSPYAMTFLSDNGSVIRHNTFLDYGICDYSQRCGTLYLGNKDSDPASRGTILKDNILTRICVCDGSVSGLAQETHNLLTANAANGLQDLFGKPTYVGGQNPSSYAAFALAAGSLGKGNASDGLDRGVRIGAIGGTPPPPPPPPPTPAPPPPPPAGAPPTARYSYSPASPAVGQEVTFDASTSACPDLPCTYTWQDDGSDGAGGTQWAIGTGQTTKFTFTGAGVKNVRLTVTDEQGRSASTVKPITVAGATPAPPPPPAPAPPTARYSYSPASPAVGQEVTFDASTSSCPDLPCTYTWQDDGSDGAGGTQWAIGTGQTAKFTFTGAGVKNVRLTVTDEQGRSASTVKPIRISPASVYRRQRTLLGGVSRNL